MFLVLLLFLLPTRLLVYAQRSRREDVGLLITTTTKHLRCDRAANSTETTMSSDLVS